MRKTLHVATVAFVLALQSQAAFAATPNSTPLTLDSAISLALRDNLSYRSARIGIEQAVAMLRQARAPEMPAVQVQDTYQYVNPVAKLTTPFGSIPFSTTSATNVPLAALQYTLFDGGITAARVSQAVAGIAIAEGNAHEARATTISAVSESYFGLLAAIRMSEVADRAVTIAQEHVKQAHAMLANGQVPRADLLRAQAELADQNVHALTAHAAVRMGQLHLDLVLHEPFATRYMPTDHLALATPTFHLESLLATAHANRGEYVAAQAALLAAKRAVTVAAGGNLPNLKLMIADGNTQPAVVSGFHNQFSLGLTAVWTLFDGGYTSGQVAAARAGVDRAQLGVEALSEGIDLQVNGAYLTVQAASAQVEAARQFARFADESLRLARVRYLGGVSTALEMQDAELRDRSARQALVQANVQLRTSVVALRFAAGLL